MNAVAAKLDSYLRALDPQKCPNLHALISEASEEIKQLDAAARLALLSADRWRERARSAELAVQLPRLGDADLVPTDIPAEVLEAADTVEQFFRRHNITRWQLGGLESRGYADQPSPPPSMAFMDEDGRQSCLLAELDRMRGITG